jgi:spore maturation protein SpmB
LLVTCSSADVLTWNFTIDEQQIRNGSETDGSTNSPGTGTGTVSYDAGNNLMSYSVQWEGLVGDLTKLHIHGPADASMSNPQHVVEILGPPAVPVELATTSGGIAGTFELTTLEQSGFDPLSPSQILDIMTSGKSYVNVHTTVFGTGEIRGNLGIPIPEPSTTAMLLGAFGSLIVARRMSM